ncbi:MAG: 4-hydroxy-tetrahydrodipicolinate synthase [Nitrospirae bacterium]|nr:MAG: 4-hydroxy-tetrahydrodipicolinate synthase [Nitrospirota bacterium]
MFRGSIVAIVTPFRDGKVDEYAFERLIEWHISEGTDAIVPCGTTGESATLNYDEHMRVIEIAIKVANNRVPIIAGTGANSTDEAIMLTEKARKLKADAALLVTPYYNKPTQEGLYRHYDEIAKKVDIPIVLYNVPSRTGVNLLPSTVARIVENNENVVAIKEASGDMRQASKIIRLCGDRLSVISGDDFTTFPILSLGGKGVISVVANIIPDKVSQMCAAFREGNIKEAKKIHYYLEPLNDVMFLQTNPIPVKTALSMMGKIKEEFRLPLCEMGREDKEVLRSRLIEYGLVTP